MLATIDTGALRRASAVSHAFANKLARFRPLSVSGPSTLALPPLSLPTPPSLAPQLVAAGVDEVSAQRISVAASQAANRIKSVFEVDYEQRCQSLDHNAQHFRDPRFLSTFPSTYSIIYAKALKRWSSYLLDDIAPRVLHARAVHKAVNGCRSQAPESKRPFNQSAIPVLEQFFNENAFPSRLEKLELAGKCGMEYKQIKDWFQNRRTRSRKAGIELSKPQKDELLREVEESIVDALLPGVSTDEGTENDWQQRQPEFRSPMLAGNDSFHLETPPHAFPSPYPPLCSYDPFPKDVVKRVFSLPWLRTTTTNWSAQGAVTGDVSSLTGAFSKLTIADGLSDNPCNSSHKVNPHLGFVTRCSRAPHPAFVYPTKASPCSSIALPRRHSGSPTRAPSLSSPSPSSSISPSSSPSSPPSSPSPASSSSSPSGPLAVSRVKRSLPKRVPKNPPAYRQPPDSRPYYASFTTSRASSVSSKSSSTESDVDSPLSTPLLAPVELDPKIVSSVELEGLLPLDSPSSKYFLMAFFDSIQPYHPS
ncbi:hypothetical protein V8D89_012916 [Ganoderma adspersum]